MFDFERPIISYWHTCPLLHSTCEIKWVFCLSLFTPPQTSHLSELRDTKGTARQLRHHQRWNTHKVAQNNFLFRLSLHRSLSSCCGLFWKQRHPCYSAWYMGEREDANGGIIVVSETRWLALHLNASCISSSHMVEERASDLMCISWHEYSERSKYFQVTREVDLRENLTGGLHSTLESCSRSRKEDFLHP